jgi:inorganic pyrophosphatase
MTTGNAAKTQGKRKGKSKDKPVMTLSGITAFDKEGNVKAIVETTKGSKNKYRYSEETGMYECGFALTAGLSFPFDFGFIPSTKAEDGDPLDVLILMDEPAFPGCLVHVHLLGLLEAKQTENGKTVRNDRLLAVHDKSIDYGQYKTLKDVPPAVLEEIELFFVIYNKCRKKEFRPLGWKSSKTALSILKSKLVVSKLA